MTGLPRMNADGPKGALLLLFEKSFLPGFKVLLHSLRRSPVLRSLDLIVITDDPEVAKHPDIQSLAKVIRLVSDDEKQRFSLLPKKAVSSKFHLAWTPKYTYLKFFIYDDYGYDFHVYLDCDILCTSNSDTLVTDFLRSDADIMGGPVFPTTLVKDENGLARDREEVHRRLTAFLHQSPKGNLNTGVLIYGRELMTPSIGDALLEIASYGDRPNEQSIVHQFIKNSSHIRFRLLSPFFNFRSSVLRAIRRDRAKFILREVKFLHFIASRPWNSTSGGGLPGQLWHAEKDSMENLD